MSQLTTPRRDAELKDQDGLDEASDPGRRAAELAEEPPGLRTLRGTATVE